MFKIGDFAKSGKVSVKLLRRYDQIGLLPPAYTDKHTGYRYYTAEQLIRLRRIQAFRELGFTLEQITDLLKADISPTQTRDLFRQKQAEIQQLVETQQARLSRLEARLQQIEREGTLSPYEVMLKHIAPYAIASIREVIAPAQLSDIFGELDEYLSYYGIELSQPHSVLWHGTRSQQGRMDIEVSCVLTRPLPDSQRIAVRTLPEVPIMACVMHMCRPGNPCDACSAIDDWSEEHGFCFAESSIAREVYLPQEGGDNPFALTEMQIPVMRRSTTDALLMLHG
ncbi:MerR family transcriptional regulator [Ktedonosporobacter rubrisoli]|uniref:MerR family transcriptional regulator n=1 Tax=Ktedonosporobacter rubrisoli TaxID=2509675 RepID=A0A4V0YYH1_KTERU|nr:helix-turn-helix domain-containing protein [Ktedonosporobacter rubrisoli]QBD76201.1 MerR family transcriptional regulator [Ktedonosporobacter rubrisoli]